MQWQQRLVALLIACSPFAEVGASPASASAFMQLAVVTEQGDTLVDEAVLRVVAGALNGSTPSSILRCWIAKIGRASCRERV